MHPLFSIRVSKVTMTFSVASPDLDVAIPLIRDIDTASQILALVWETILFRDRGNQLQEGHGSLVKHQSQCHYHQRQRQHLRQ
jgi:hypothetical protein